MRYLLVTNANMLAPDLDTRFPNAPRVNDEKTVYGVKFNVGNKRDQLCEGDEFFVRFRLGEGKVKVSKITNSSKNYYEIHACNDNGLSIVFRPFEVDQIEDSIVDLGTCPPSVISFEDDDRTDDNISDSEKDDDLPF